MLLDLGADPAAWTAEAPWQPLIALGQHWLTQQGLDYQADGEVSGVKTGDHGGGETP